MAEIIVTNNSPSFVETQVESKKRSISWQPYLRK